MHKIVIIGNLGSDPEMRVTPSGDAVTSFSLASNRRYKNRDGEQVEETSWFRITCWRQLAETANTYLEKGRSVYIEGRPEINTYEDKNGEFKATIQVTANELQFLGGGQGGDSKDGNQGDRQQQGSRQNSGGNRQQGGGNRQSGNQGANRQQQDDAPASNGSKAGRDDWDNADDLPF